MSPWSPLLTGARRAEAESRLAELAAALSVDADSWLLASPPNPNGIRAVSLALGRCGFSLFHAWYHVVTGSPQAAETAHRFLGESIELLPQMRMDESLYCGFPGVAWTTEHVLRLLDAADDDDPIEGLDEELIGFLDNPEFRPCYDLIGGLAGLGVYALERRGRRTALPLAERILARLERMATPMPGGTAWPSGGLTRRAMADDVKPEDRYYNLGMSHGIPGVLAILARLAEFPELRERALALLAPGTTWLRAQRLPAGSAGAFSDYVADGFHPAPARVAWCYGDPGVAAALVAAGRVLGDRDAVAAGLDAAHHAIARPIETTEVVDAGFCHGAAGLAHTFARLAQQTGDPACRDAAIAWYDRTLQRVDDRPNIAGFPIFCFERNHDGEYLDDPGMLPGAAGIGLALLAGISDQDPAWDRLFLLDSVG